MRRWFNSGVLAVLLPGPAAAAPAPVRYDPEVSLLVQSVQKQSVGLMRDELVRQAEWLDLGGMKVLLAERGDEIAGKVRDALAINSDVLADYRRRMVDLSPGSVGQADRLVAEIRRYHDLVPGPPLERVAAPEGTAKGPELIEEPGIGADLTAALEGAQAMDEPVAYAERRFGLTGPFLRQRQWNLDFYLGAFEDLLPHYRRLGYKRFYRLRAPYVSYGKQAYVLTPEEGLRPRIVFCAFYGQDLFVHTRAQWAVLARQAQGEGPLVRTLSCPGCTWTLPGVRAMRSLLNSSPFTAENVVIGYETQFQEAWKDKVLGTYENEYWRLTYYRTEPAVSAILEARHTNFGEILAASITPLVRRGTRRVFYAGPSAQLDPRLDASELLLPTEFAYYKAAPRPFDNLLRRGRGRRASLGSLPSPLFATREWLAVARKAGLAAFDAEASRLAEEASRWAALPGKPVRCGIGATLGSFASLHPEEDRALYTVTLANQVGKEPAKKKYRDLVLAIIRENAD